MHLVKVRAKGQLTIPDEVRRAARLAEGDFVDVSVSVSEGTIILRPTRVIDAAQAWFWTDEWQRGEREASADIAEGRTRRFESAEEFVASLDE